MKELLFFAGIVLSVLATLVILAGAIVLPLEYLSCHAKWPKEMQPEFSILAQCTVVPSSGVRMPENAIRDVNP